MKKPKKDEKRFLVKAQRPIYSNVDSPMVLLYNQKRTFQTQIPFTAQWAKLFGLKYKVFCWIHINKDGRITLVRRVSDQFW